MSDEEKGGRARGQLSADDPSGTGTTIVGGQPPGQRRAELREVPIGLEKVLYTAAIDREFREELLRDREQAIQERGLSLKPSELSMLRLAPAEQLAAAIDALDTSQTNLERRRFMGAVAGAVTLAAGSVLSGCSDDTEAPAGIRPDDASPTRGIQPDIPRYLGDMGIRPEGLKTGFDSGGIRPDDVGADGRKPDGK